MKRASGKRHTARRAGRDIRQQKMTRRSVRPFGADVGTAAVLGDDALEVALADGGDDFQEFVAAYEAATPVLRDVEGDLEILLLRQLR